MTFGRWGAVLKRDDFEDESLGILQSSSSNASQSTRGYVDFEYVIRKVSESSMVILRQLPGIYGNTTIAADAMIMARPGLRPQDTSGNLFVDLPLVWHPGGRLTVSSLFPEPDDSRFSALMRANR